MIFRGDCREVLRGLADSSIDAVVTDPPYELGFMGKAWDSSGVAYRVDLWGEVLRVLKPGGHLLAFGGSRTYHRLACAVEDAGFEIRDQIMWVYGSGFPKSLDVSKAIDKMAGAEREVVGQAKRTGKDAGTYGAFAGDNLLTAPATDAAKQWSGWGTALKPAHEPVVVARKPLVGTVAQNVLLWGTGAINIDGCRVGTSDKLSGGHSSSGQQMKDGWRRPWMDDEEKVQANIERSRASVAKSEALGRWPANLIHDGSDEVLEHFPDAKGGQYPARRGQAVTTGFASGQLTEGGARSMGDDGSAARFFYCAKAGRAERNAGLDATANTHPTVKPVALMRYLVRLVTPPDGVVLDPFLGSGTTAVAAILEGKRWVGCELTEEYVPIIEGRVAWAEANRGML